MTMRTLMQAALAVMLGLLAALTLTPAMAAPKKNQDIQSSTLVKKMPTKRKVAAAKRKISPSARLNKSARNRLASYRAKRAKQRIASRPRRSGGGAIAWNAPGNCLPAPVKSALYAVVANFGPITVNSTYRSRGHNRAVGGAGKSMHLQCRAADFRVNSGGGGVLGFLQKQPGLGGIKRYRSGYFHIDNGPRRTWAG